MSAGGADMSEPTVTRDEAEIVVVGGGPAGASAALVLGELGHDVLVIDKDEFPRDKPCGDGLMHPAVAAAERMGLDDLIESSLEIEGARFILGHRKQSQTRFATYPGRPMPRCITRRDFDAALIAAAQQRGARLLRARVDGVEEEGDGHRVIAVAGGETFAVRAGTVIGADGATSRVRRATTTASPAKSPAYAARQYFVSEKPLDPVFDTYVPMEIGGTILAGYGWVFPLDEHRANIGVGIYNDTPRSPKLRRVLAAFVEELQSKEGYRFGELKAIGEPFGSPIGMRSPIEVSEMPGVILTGDAAGTTHPVTGEGIPFAIRGGEAVARVVHARSKGKKLMLRGADHDDAAVWRAFPQIGIDVSGLNRIGVLEVNQGAATESSGGSVSVSEPLLATVKRMQVESAYDTEAKGTPAWAALDAHSPAFGDWLERANGALLDGFAHRMPFVTEVIYRSIRSHLGPMYAAVTIATAGRDGSELPDTVLDAAVAAEALGVLPELLTMLVDRARSKAMRVNNVLTGDFSATRALPAAVRLGTPAIRALALAGQQGCEGGMRDSAARFDAERSPDSWFSAASETAGAATVLATQLGTIVRGKGDESADTLRAFGVELGIAIRLAEEIVDLVVGDDLYPGREGEDLKRGIYPLPVLYAVEADKSLARLLAQHTAEDGSPAEIIAVVRESGALERSVAECAKRGEAARGLALELPGAEGDLLAALAGVPLDYVESRLPAGDAAPTPSVQQGG
jgi:geranylgeranyl reductase family protein